MLIIFTFSVYVIRSNFLFMLIIFTLSVYGITFSVNDTYSYSHIFTFTTPYMMFLRYTVYEPPLEAYCSIGSFSPIPWGISKCKVNQTSCMST